MNFSRTALVRRLEATFGKLGPIAEDAVYTAFLKVLEDGERLGVRDVPDYVTAIAFNFVKRELRRRRREELYGDDAPEPLPFEDDAEAQALLAAINELIDPWENRNLKVVTKLVIEASFRGDRLSGDELVRLASDIVGEELSITSVAKWKQRGLDRLAAEVVSTELFTHQRKEKT